MSSFDDVRQIVLVVEVHVFPFTVLLEGAGNGRREPPLVLLWMLENRDMDAVVSLIPRGTAFRRIVRLVFFLRLLGGPFLVFHNEKEGNGNKKRSDHAHHSKEIVKREHHATDGDDR